VNSLLKQISEKAIELVDFAFTQEHTINKWLGTTLASENEIILTKKRLGIDYLKNIDTKSNFQILKD
jgi:hypothetical protein